MFKTNLPPLTL